MGDCALPATGSSSGVLIVVATIVLAAGVGAVLLARHGRQRTSMLLVVAAVGAALAMAAPRADAAATCPTPTTTVAPTTTTPATTSSTSTTSTSTTSTTTTTSPTTTTATTTAPPVIASLAGTYTRDGHFITEAAGSPPGDYVSPPGTDWDLPTVGADAGPVAGATVELHGAGPNGTFGDGDDTLATTVTDDGGAFSFAIIVAGPYRVTITDLPTPDHTYFSSASPAQWTWPGGFAGGWVSPWEITAPAGGTTAAVIVAAGDAVTGQNFIATNTWDAWAFTT